LGHVVCIERDKLAMAGGASLRTKYQNGSEFQRQLPDITARFHGLPRRGFFMARQWDDFIIDEGVPA
jgi:hypothetical protein